MRKSIRMTPLVMLFALFSQMIVSPVLGMAEVLNPTEPSPTLSLNVIDEAGERQWQNTVLEKEQQVLEISATNLKDKPISIQLGSAFEFDGLGTSGMASTDYTVSKDESSNQVFVNFNTDKVSTAKISITAVQVGLHQLIATSENINSNGVSIEVGSAPVEEIIEADVVESAQQRGRELKDKNFVNSISFEPVRIRGGEETTMTVTFPPAESNIKVYAGDRLTLTLPDELSAYYREEPTEVILNGEVVGHAKVARNNLHEIVIEFNQTAEEFSSLKNGQLIMDLKATVLPNPENIDISEDFTSDLGTDAAAAPFTIYQGKSGTGTRFFSKVGNIQPDDADKIWWYIRVNGDYSGFDNDIVVVDTLGEGQTIPKNFLEESFFRIWENDSNNELSSLSFSEAIEEGYVSIDKEDDKTLKFTFHRGIMKTNMHMEAYYQTRLTAEGKLLPDVFNTATVAYQQNGKDVITEPSVAKVKPPTSSGIIYPGPGTLKLMKYIDKNGIKTLLPGVTFDLFKSDGTLRGKNLKTNEKGIVEFEDLEPGEYYVIETDAPSTVEFDKDKKYYFEIKEDGRGVILPIINQAKEIIGNLETEKLINKEEVMAGDRVMYTIIARNTIPDSVLHNVIVADELPKGIELIEGTIKLDDVLIDAPIKDNRFEWTIPTIEGVGAHRITFEALVTEEADEIIENIAVVTSGRPDIPGEPTEPQYPNVKVPVIPIGKLEAEKVVDKKIAKIGERLTYKITARNLVEGSNLTNIVVEDNLPDSLKLVEDSIRLDGEFVDYKKNQNGFTLTISSLKGLAESQITFEAIVTEKADQKIKNVAILTPENPSIPGEPGEPLKPEVEIPVMQLLPSTGGPGVLGYLLFGSALMLSAFAFLIFSIKKEVA